MLISHIARFKWLGFHDQLKQEATSGKHVNPICIVLSLAQLISYLRRVTFKRTHPVAHLVLNRLQQLVHRVTSVPEIDHLDIKLSIQQYILRFDIAMSYPAAMNTPQGRYKLPEYEPSRPLMELLCLVNQSKQLTVLLNLHNIVKNALDTTVGRTVDSSHIEIDDLNNMAMLSLMGHLHLV